MSWLTNVNMWRIEVPKFIFKYLGIILTIFPWKKYVNILKPCIKYLKVSGNITNFAEVTFESLYGSKEVKKICK